MPAHERTIKIRPLVENSILCLLVVGIADSHVLLVENGCLSGRAVLLPGVVDGNVQKHHEGEQESANAPGKANLREFAAEESHLGIGGNVAQQEHAHAVVNHPGDQHDCQVNRAHVHNDRPKEAGEFQGGAVVHLLLFVFLFALVFVFLFFFYKHYISHI